MLLAHDRRYSGLLRPPLWRGLAATFSVLLGSALALVAGALLPAIVERREIPAGLSGALAPLAAGLWCAAALLFTVFGTGGILHFLYPQEHSPASGRMHGLLLLLCLVAFAYWHPEGVIGLMELLLSK